MRYNRIKVAMKKEDDMLVLYNSETGNTHVLNSTAAMIYDQCEAKSSEQIINDIAQNVNNVNRDEIREDVEAILNQFQKAGLIIEAIA